MADYWSSLEVRRISRRRALVATGGARRGVPGRVRWQRDSSSGGDGSSLVTKPVDTSKTVGRGGTNKWYLNADPAGFDVHVGGVPKNNPKNPVYSNLVSAKPGYMKEPDFADYIPDIAKSWEWSPDALSLTLKIQPDAKWHNKAPVNGARSSWTT